MSELYHRTILVVEVLGREPFSGDLAGLSDAVTDRKIFNGDGLTVATVLSKTTDTIDSALLTALLTTQRSDPSFLLDADEGEHTEGDGCAIYLPEYEVHRPDGEPVTVEDLAVGDMFIEHGKAWLVNDTRRDGEDVHIDLEPADG